MPSATIRDLIHRHSFVADYKGTCVLCLGTVHPDESIVKIEHSAVGVTVERNVHENCAFQFCDSARKDGKHDSSIVDPFLAGIAKLGKGNPPAGHSEPDPSSWYPSSVRTGKRIPWKM
jgi:hypothetical protein